MGKFNQEEFNRFIVDNGVVGFFKEPITLKSGVKSHWYINWRNVAGDAYLLDKLTDFIISFASEKGLAPDCFYGVPEGATKTATLANHKLAKTSANYGPGSHVMPMGRGKPKEHGNPKDRFFVGEPKGRTLVIEDVTTTGGSLITALNSVLEAGTDVVAAVGLSNRMEKRSDGLSVQEAIQKQYNGKVVYLAMSSALELLPMVVAKLKPAEDVLNIVEQEFAERGVQPIKLR